MEIQWSLVLYSLFMGLSIGPFALIALTDACGKRDALCKWASAVGLGCIVIAGLSAFSHLKQPLHAVYMFGNFRSPMTQETAAVLITGVVAAVLAAMLLFNLLPGVSRRSIALLGLVLSIVSVVMIAMIYLLPVRPAWNTWLLPITLLASSLVNGLLLAWALVALVPKQKDESDRKELAAQLRSWALPALVVYAVLVVVFFITAAGNAGGMSRLLTGDLALLFWLGLVVVGLIAPAILVWMDKKGAKVSATAAFLLVFVGGLVMRAIIFPLGTRIDITKLW